MTTKPTKSKRGGARPGAGRKEKPEEQKFVHTSVTFPTEVHALAVKMSDAGRFPSMSAYITELVKGDRAMAGKIDALASPDSALAVLVDRLAPALRRQFDDAVAGRDIDQAAYLTALLAAGIRHLKSGADHEAPFAIVPLVPKSK